MTEPRSKADKDAGNLGETAKSYVYQVLAESITGITPEVSSQSMQWGVDHEAQAIDEYSKAFLENVTKCGFIPFGEYGGGSADGLIGDDGLIEVKCPYNSAVHVENLLLAKSMPTNESFKENHKDYFYQIQNNLLVTNRAFCRFVSYDPRFTGQNRLACITIHRDEIEINKINLKLIRLQSFCKN